MSAQDLATLAEPESKTRLRLWLRMLKATRIVESELRERLRVEFGSTLPRFDVMSALYRHSDGLKMSQLSGVLKVSNGNVTGIVERLVEDGLVTREKVPGDRRAALVRLTEKGNEEFTKQANAHENWVNELLSDVEQDRATRLATLLADISNISEDDET